MKPTWLPAALNPAVSKYLALVQSIELGVAEGALRAGDKLPSNREISEVLGITVATVTRAMGEATLRGLVESRVGSGTFIRAAPVARSQNELYELSANVLPTAIVRDVLDKAMSCLPAETRINGLFSHRSYWPSPAHRKLAAAWINAESATDRLLYTSGVTQGLLAAFRALLKPGDKAICEGLIYPGIKRIADYTNVELIGARCDESGVIPESVDECLRASGAKVVILTPTLHNPTTATLPLARREALVALLREHDAMLIEDGVNDRLANHGLGTLTSLAPERAIYLTGFSKCVASGFRLGYALVPDNLIRSFHEGLVSTQWTAPGFYADLAEQMLKDGSVQVCMERHRVEAHNRVASARALLPIWNAPDPGYHVWVPTKQSIQADEFCARAVQAGIRISPGSHFAVANMTDPAGYRISLGFIDSAAQRDRALSILASLNVTEEESLFTLI